ncbi:RDD family protein [Mesorhizobium sp. CA18]|uniref:RDD family protein n=1 Tax=unclassified Mesorhizobium TaxID=325217 RepID=UPI001CCC8ED2|nr:MULTISPECIES: RDD family protein [unclassified Mesorhizobium]MBZ9734766.1 RDD family protein [Mesorhizobium sp. CA9]MBZ9827065.1 RDD family protein [Mesorhizobium sp. CA18]MBZ9832509.1 RDD family protein [Mesorhizobium sp. CA2]MBZ9838745.1 RDD family protein [Mesorhizobium sp. CA3]MBZ9879353.1 RDD family protein [Mesorhizobium sp. Ca11]
MATARTAKAKNPAALIRPLVTPEGVDLRVKLADAGTRASGFLLDVVIIVVAAVVISLVMIFGLAGLGIQDAEPLFIVWIIFIFFLRNVYFIAFEAGRRAATPGKRMVGVRVASRSGAGLTIDQVIARNLMREIEVFLPLSILAARASADVADTLSTIFGLVWALLFSLFPLFNRDRLRIGDLLAGTWVVEAPKVALIEDLSQRKNPVPAGFQFSPAQLDTYGIAELQKLEEVLRRDDYSALKAVAETIARKIGARVEPIDSKAFLTAYYGELRAHLERKLLLGNRKADKYAR